MSVSSAVGLSPLDVAAGIIFGHQSAEPLPETGLAPQEALALALRRALERPPCLVSYSGGRDSSALLALATHVARRDGLAEPIPFSVRFVGASAAEESAWQELTVEHLRLGEWLREELSTEGELIGPLARYCLTKFGVLFPYNLHLHLPCLRAARGGSLVTGMAGDELFTLVQWWGAVLAVARSGRLPHPYAAARLLARGLPRSARGALVARRLELDLPWLWPGVERTVRGEAACWLADQPVNYAESLTRWWWPSRYLQIGLTGLRLLADDQDVYLAAPFADPVLLVSLARTRGRVGFSDRSSAMAALFGDFLPARVVRRTSKATFEEALFGPESVAFTENWNGEGADESLVNRQVLQRMWRDPDRDARTFLALQAAWLSGQGHTGTADILAPTETKPALPQ